MKTLKTLGLILMVLVTGTSLVSCGEDYESRLPELLIKDMKFESGSDPLETLTQEQVFRNEDLSNYIITADQAWCFPHIDVDNCKIVVVVNGNDTYDERTAIVTITDTKASKDRSFTVTQAQLDAILTDQADYTVPSAGGELPITVKYNVDYTVEVSSDWIHYNVTTRGLEEKVLTFTVDENNSGDERYGSVRILNSDKGVEAKATIRQRFSPFLEVSKTKYTIDELGQDIEISYSTNIALTVESEYYEDWWEDAKTEKVDETHFIRTLSIDPFTDKKDSRTCNIIFQGSKYAAFAETITITQERTLYIPEIEETESGKIELYVGDSVKVNYINTKDRKVKWTSSDEKIVTVNEKGQVKAIALGEATVTLKSADGKYSDKVTVLVKTPEDITDALSCDWSEDISYADDGTTITGYTISNTLMNDSEYPIYVTKCSFYNNGVLVKNKAYNSRTGQLSPGGAIEMPQATVATKKDYYVEWDYTYCNEEYTLKYTQAGEKTITKKVPEATTTTTETPAATSRKNVRSRR